MILPNTLRDKLDAGEPTVGTHIMSADPDLFELVGDTGLFDYGEFCAEYSVLDTQMLFHFARAAQCGNLPLMIKPDQEGQGFWTQSALGAGFKAVLFTDIRTPEDIDTCHAIIAPDNPANGGHMGVKLRRPALGGYDTDAYLKDLESIVFAIMIEKDVAFTNLDDILARAKEKGVDMVQWGRADFAFSRGQAGKIPPDEIKGYEETVIASCMKHGIRARAEIGAVEQAQRYLDLGVKDFCIGWDRFILNAQFRSLGNGMRDLLAK